MIGGGRRGVFRERFARQIILLAPAGLAITSPANNGELALVSDRSIDATLHGTVIYATEIAR